MPFIVVVLFVALGGGAVIFNQKVVKPALKRRGRQAQMEEFAERIEQGRLQKQIETGGGLAPDGSHTTTTVTTPNPLVPSYADPINRRNIYEQ